MSYIEWIRSRVGQRQIILAFSSVVLRDSQGRILLQRRSDFDVWGLPGGILEPGESILDCARRELVEETGLRAGDLSLVGVYSEPRYDTIYPNGDRVQQYTICFQGRLAGGEMRVDGVETSDLAFFAPSEIPFAALPSFYADMLHDALNGVRPAYRPPFAAPQLYNPIEELRPLIGRHLYIGAGAIAVVVRPQDGRILAVERTDSREWSLPGGFMHRGENIAHTAIRELREETGLEIELERLLGVYSPADPWVYPNGDQTQAVISIFRAHPTGDGEPRPDAVETSRVAWMTPAELLAVDTHPRLARLNREVTEHLDGGVFIL